MSYKGPDYIFTMLSNRQTLQAFFLFTIKRFVKRYGSNIDDTFIPPIIYNESMRAYNIDYCYLVDSLADFFENEAIRVDFNPTEETKKNCVLLSFFILEYWHDVAFGNSAKSAVRPGSHALTFYPFKECLYERNGAYVKVRVVGLKSSPLLSLLDQSMIDQFNGICFKSDMKVLAFSDRNVSTHCAALGITVPYVF